MENGRICTKCAVFKLFDEFYKSKNKTHGRESLCKICSKHKGAKYHLNNIEKQHIKSKKHYEKNRELISLRDKARVDEIRDIKRLYRKNNKEKVNKHKREYRKTKITINYKIAELIRNRIRCVLNNGISKATNKKNRTIELIGCTYEELRVYLESKFTQGMTWENRGNNGWHIDHIKPCSSFDLTDIAQQKECFHYANLQPLWATREIAISYGEGPDYVGNLEKGNKIIQ
jgi:hypothetical protein